MADFIDFCEANYMCLNFVKWLFLDVVCVQCLPRIVLDEPLSEGAFEANLKSV